MKRFTKTGGLFIATALLTGTALAGGHKGDGDQSHKQIGQYSGFEGNEATLGAAIVKAIASVANNKGERHDFTGRELEVGLAVSKTIKTLNSASAYQHEMNDALVKMTLEFIQYAKDEGNIQAVARKDAMTQFPMLMRVAKIVEATGRQELALIAITDQTTCFFQLAGEVERGTGFVRYRAPYGNVLTQTRRMGMHDLTEQEIHEQWTIPHIEVWSELLGVDIAVSAWQDDGMVTLSIPELAETMAANVE